MGKLHTVPSVNAVQGQGPIESATSDGPRSAGNGLVNEETPSPQDRPWLRIFAGEQGTLAAGHPHDVLLSSIKEHFGELEATLEKVNGHWGYEDLIYRFWHQSFKVYLLQELTEQIVDVLRSVAPPGTDLHPWFLDIVATGTGRRFELSHNADWTGHTRPIVEAFFHARFMLEMVVRYGRDLDAAPMLLPSGWAAVLELYGVR